MKDKDLVFVEASTNKTFTIHSKHMEWYRNNRKRGIDGGWYLIGTHGNDVAESFAIEDELGNDIADTPPAEGGRRLADLNVVQWVCSCLMYHFQ